MVMLLLRMNVARSGHPTKQWRGSAYRRLIVSHPRWYFVVETAVMMMRDATSTERPPRRLGERKSTLWGKKEEIFVNLAHKNKNKKNAAKKISRALLLLLIEVAKCASNNITHGQDSTSPTATAAVAQSVEQKKRTNERRMPKLRKGQIDLNITSSLLLL